LKDPAIDAALGVAAGAAATNAYRDYQASNAPELASEDAGNEDRGRYYDLASHEAAQVSAPDTESLRNLASVEATTIAASDADPRSPLMVDGRSQGTSIFTDGSAATPMSNDTAPISTSQTVLNSETANPRPTLVEAVRAGQHHESVQSISQLHVPGEYPKNSATGV